MLFGQKSGTITLLTVTWPDISTAISSSWTLLTDVLDFSFTFGYILSKTYIQTSLYIFTVFVTSLASIFYHQIALFTPFAVAGWSTWEFGNFIYEIYNW